MHDEFEHFSVFSLFDPFSLQWRPPFWGNGSSHVRKADFLPMPQVTEHGVQAPHWPHPPSTKIKTVNLKSHYSAHYFLWLFCNFVGSDTWTISNGTWNIFGFSWWWMKRTISPSIFRDGIIAWASTGFMSRATGDGTRRPTIPLSPGTINFFDNDKQKHL